MNTDTMSSRRRAPAAASAGSSPAIDFSVADCSLGKVLVARGGQGVCAILMGSDGAELERDLQARFPARSLARNDAVLAADIASVVRFIEAPRAGLDLDLELGGTPFQRRVWDELRSVPAGKTTSYAELARRIGDPKSVRAVANACGANAIALAIPCHRVVRSDGSLSGYRWGVDRKQALISREAKA